ncbi:Plus-3 domain [Musa troglodytarum]|uniref:Plus-3 domain n=1 Tax=Musa troglodytarum TaxID=320322 RepID=A0A9E7FRR5_9LILI|nr:Plus-3 domain [Musa troglodytarum]
MKKDEMNKEEIAEDYCFACKDGGHLRVCDFNSRFSNNAEVHLLRVLLFGGPVKPAGWHSCFICQKASTFQCYCCPSSVCRSCIKEAEFVQVKKRTKGFCNNCLKLAILIEENIDVDSDGGKVDFRDSETYEFLFKEYWEIIKDQEGLKLADLQTANTLLKRGENLKGGSESDRSPEDDAGSEFDELEDNLDDGLPFLEEPKGMHDKSKKRKKRSTSKKRVFSSWGSVELIKFLTSIDKDTKEPLTLLDACDIIKDYIQTYNLCDPDTKKKTNVVCDDRLYALFRKRKVKFHKIYSLLESHFASDNVSDDEFSSEEGDDSFARHKKRNTAADSNSNKSHPKNYEEDISVPAESYYASIIGRNINLVYLKRSLIVEFLRNPDTFEEKVTGCFVRVKVDPNEFYSVPERMYKLGQIDGMVPSSNLEMGMWQQSSVCHSGVKKALQAYKIGEMSTDMVLCVSDMHKDVQISMLSEDDFEEDECEYLRHLANEGLFRRPTIVELEKKIKSVHADIMNHKLLMQAVCFLFSLVSGIDCHSHLKMRVALDL